VHKQVELTAIDLKFADCRLKSVNQEKILLASICERGIEQPLQGIFSNTGQGNEHRPVLLDGFKRLRCAQKLGINVVPFLEIAEDEPSGILTLLRVSNARSLTLLEQARLVDELKREYRMNLAEISTRLERSKAWVIVRLDVISKMSPSVRDEVFSGRFPAYSYLYTLRQFRRLTGTKQSEEEEFVRAVSGKGLSTRDIEIVARGYFQGGEVIRAQVRDGNIGWCLSELKRDLAADHDGARGAWSEEERSTIRDLEILMRLLGRLAFRLEGVAGASSGFFAEAGLLASGVLRRWEQSEVVIRRFYDRCRNAGGDNHPQS
jgi:hypothetical protein